MRSYHEPGCLVAWYSGVHIHFPSTQASKPRVQAIKRLDTYDNYMPPCEASNRGVAGATFLEAIGAVKTERREYESLLLLNALLKHEPIPPSNQARMAEFAKRNKVQLRSAALLQLPKEKEAELQADVDEGFRLYDFMSKTFEENQVDYTTSFSSRSTRCLS